MDNDMSALEKQVGGTHYKKHAIQPIEYIEGNGLGYCEGAIIKYATRWKDKGGIEDLKKIIHYAELLIEIHTEGLEKLKPHEPNTPPKPDVILEGLDEERE